LSTRLINLLGELASYHAKYGTNTIFGTNYQRDSLGRITQITEAVEGVATVKRYSYDIAGRLEKVWRNDTLVSVYIYDANGNRISHWTSSRVDSGSYDAQDRMLSYGNAQYFYTPNGELKMKVEGTDTTFYTYDYFGNLKTVILPNKDRIDYIIDGQNRKIGKKVNGQIVKKWIYSGQLTPVAELDSTGNITARFAGSYMIKDGNTYQLITDHLGSVRLVVDVATGTVMQRLDYDEHGNVSYDSNPDFTPFGFCGGLYDNQTKLTRFGARDYDAETGRWTAKDPIGFGGGVSNLYEYCLNDPINLFDRKGFQVIYGQESPSNIVMTFNGNTLTIKTNVGNGIIIGMYPAISGPYGKGRLPEGIYEATNLRRRTMKGMVCPGEEMGWSIDLSDAPGRDYLRIHPDAPPEGTEGCIGVLCSVSEDFYNQVKPYFEAGTPMVYLYVQY
jgi:RHS repeat-associated protein